MNKEQFLAHERAQIERQQQIAAQRREHLAFIERCQVARAAGVTLETSETPPPRLAGVYAEKRQAEREQEQEQRRQARERESRIAAGMQRPPHVREALKRDYFDKLNAEYST